MFKNSSSLIKPNTFPFFYGYVILVVGSIGILFSIPGQTVGVSVFTDPVKDALNLSRNQFSSAYMLGTLISAFFVTRAGFLFDRLGARYVAFLAALLLGLTLLVCSVSPSISQTIQDSLKMENWIISFVLMTFLFFILRFSGQGVLTMASRNMVMMWFDKNRGKINAISSVTVSLGFSSAPLVFNSLIERYGWQSSWQILSVCLFLFCLVIWQFYKNKPEDFGLETDGPKNTIQSTSQESKLKIKDYTLAEAKRTRAFWIMGLALAFNSFFITGLTFHVVSIFGVQGYERTEAIAVFIPISIIGITISTLANILSDYIPHKYYIYFMLGSGILASVGLWYLSCTIGLYLLIFGLGVMGGLFSVVNAVTWPRYYGRQYLGSITGKVMSFLVIASAIAPAIFSLCFTYLNDYKYVAIISSIFLICLSVGSISLKKPE